MELQKKLEKQPFEIITLNVDKIRDGYPTLFLLDGDGIMRARGHDIPHDEINDLMVGQVDRPEGVGVWNVRS